MTFLKSIKVFSQVTRSFGYRGKKVEQRFNPEDYIRRLGYPVETHKITTEDGYIMTYHRIPYGVSPLVFTTKRKPVLVQHGLFAASPAWVISYEALGYTLADAGFDVWLGNARGNTYSRKHVKYDPDKDKEAFWDFSWHEMGYYDLPASIDYILNVTDSEQLIYIGHSMGTTMYFVFGATRPEYADKIQAAIALAPVVFPWNVHSKAGSLMTNSNKVFDWLFKTLSIHEMLPYSKTKFWLDQNIFSREQLQFICADIIFSICGYNEKQLSRIRLPIILEYMPAGSSYKVLQHYGQICKKGADFKQFDYGYEGNMWRYGISYPPIYNLTNAKAPTFLYYGMNDWVAVPQDVYYTAQHLPNVQGVIKVPDHQFNHVDFMWAIDAKNLLYNDIISRICKLTN